MSRSARIGIIGAGGWLGQAFSKAIVEAGVVSAADLTLSYRSRQPDLLPAAEWTRDNQALADRSDVIIVCVRPEDFPEVAIGSSAKLVISVMAGITSARLGQFFDTDRVVRCLPNGAAEVGRSYTPWFGSDGLSTDDVAMIQRILETVGDADRVSRESDIDYLTGLTGSGPAFPALLAAAMMTDAIARGIEAEIARKAVNAVLVGTGRLVELWGQDPGDIVETFRAYRGTTAAAIDTMRAAGFDAAVSKGLGAALEKSISMGRDPTVDA